MYPSIFPPERAKNPRLDSEHQVFKALQNQLDDTWNVFYDIWLPFRNKDGRSSDAEADFILVHPNFHILCLEVKGGRLEQQDDGIYLTRHDGSRDRVKSPKEQATGIKHELLKQLPRLLPGGTRLSIQTAVCFPRAYRKDQHFRGIEPEEIVYGEEICNIGERIPKIVRHHQGQDNPPPLGEVLIRACKKYLLLPDRIGSPTALKVLAAENALFELTEEQKGVLASLRRSRRFSVAGGPGTGKTVIAFEQAKWLASNGRRTLLTCFNSPLAARLRQQAPQDLTSLDVMTFNILHNKITGANGTEINIDAMKAGIAANPPLCYDAIVVDEGQNFKAEWWTLLELLLRDSEMSELHVFYDQHQNLHGGANAFPWVFVRDFPEGMWLDRLTPPGWAGHQLVLNVRNTRQIAEAAMKIVSDLQIEVNNVDGDEIELRPCSDPYKEVGKKLLELKRAQIPFSEVVVLTGRNRESIQAMERAGQNQFGAFSWTNSPNLRGETVYFETARRFQGLESPIVLLLDIEPILSAPSALLVALTRAKSHLSVFGQDQTIVQLMQKLGRLGSTLNPYITASGINPFDASQVNVFGLPRSGGTTIVPLGVDDKFDPLIDTFDPFAVEEPKIRKTMPTPSTIAPGCGIAAFDAPAVQDQSIETFDNLEKTHSILRPQAGQCYSCKVVEFADDGARVRIRLAADVYADQLGLLKSPTSEGSNPSRGSWISLEVVSVNPLELRLPSAAHPSAPSAI